MATEYTKIMKTRMIHLTLRANGGQKKMSCCWFIQEHGIFPTVAIFRTTFGVGQQRLMHAYTTFVLNWTAHILIC